MIYSIGIIFLIGILFAKIAELLKLPRLLGMLIAGIIIGPYVLNLIDKDILNISSQLRTIALVIILLRAGLTLDIDKITEVGRPAILLSFLPATFEILAYTFLAQIIFNIDILSSAIIGTIISAVSPAVVVPSMINVIESGYGNKKGIGQMILAGASLDDVFVLSIFSSLISISTSGEFSIYALFNIPISILSGILFGIITGFVLGKLLIIYSKNTHFNLILIFSICLIFVGLKNEINTILPFSEMLFVISVGLSYSINSTKENVSKLKVGFNGLWYGFEIILFVLIGAVVDIRYTIQSGILGLILIFICLIIRMVGVFVSILSTNLNKKEKLFTMISYLPKATVQAAIGAIPLSLGLPNGELILSISVLSIIITAPLGAIGINSNYKKLLEK